MFVCVSIYQWLSFRKAGTKHVIQQAVLCKVKDQKEDVWGNPTLHNVNELVDCLWSWAINILAEGNIEW